MILYPRSISECFHAFRQFCGMTVEGKSKRNVKIYSQGSMKLGDPRVCTYFLLLAASIQNAFFVAEKLLGQIMR